MPRDGSNIYSQPFPDVVEDTTIESTVYNGFTNDVAQDLNTARPIVAGGTGATNARDAIIALSGEIANQVVTNYDSFPFVSGSFYSAVGATSAPDGINSFAGICVIPNNDPAYAILEATVLAAAPGARYTRVKQAGVWSSWVAQVGSAASLDAAYVNISGDTMTGSLFTTGELHAGTGGTSGVIRFGNTGTKFLTYDGSNFALQGGAINISGNIIALGGSIWATAAPTTGTYQFGNSGAKFLAYDGTNYTLTGGPFFTPQIISSSSIASALTATTGTYYFGSSGTKSLSYDGTNYTLAGGNLTTAQHVCSSLISGSSATVGAVYFGTNGVAANKYLTFDGTGFILSGGNLTTNNPVLIGPGPWSSLNSILRLSYVGGGTQYGLTLKASDSSSTTAVHFENGSGGTQGTITVTASAAAYNTSSDGRLKEDLKAFDAGNIIDAIDVYDFAWKGTGERSYGVVAQQAAKVYPTAVTYLKEADWYGTDYSKFVPLLLQEIKSLRERVAALEAK